MSSEKKMTTGGFFRALFRHAIGAGENPIPEVIKKGLEANGQKVIIETKATEQEESQDGNPNHERASSKVEAS